MNTLPSTHAMIESQEVDLRDTDTDGDTDCCLI